MHLRLLTMFVMEMFKSCVLLWSSFFFYHTLWFGQGWEREGGHLVEQATTVGFFQHVGSMPSFVGPLGSAEGGCTFFTAAALGASMHTAKYTPQPLSILSIVANGGTEGDVAKKKKKTESGSCLLSLSCTVLPLTVHPQYAFFRQRNVNCDSNT